MAVLGRATRGRVLYARSDIEAFRGVERFSDYKKTKRRIQRSLAAETPKDRTRRWHLLLSDKGLTAIIALGTVAIAVISVLTLIVTLR
jgi:hypothetical protein